MMYLPVDIIRQILLRLLVKSLLRLTCVCKTWRYLILSDQFVDSHTQFGHHMEIVFSSGKNFCGDREFRSSDQMILENYLQGITLSKTLQLKDNYRVIGHCNGIICLVWGQKLPGIILLWNPAIRQCRTLPRADHYYPGEFLACRVGFGYDAWNRDYKVVRLSRGHSKLMTYSLKNDSWKSIINSSLKLGHVYSFSDESGLFFKGRLYWICFKSDENVGRAYCLLVFDLAKEEILEFDLSGTFTIGNHDIVRVLGIFRGCISVLIHREDYEPHSFEIWSMEDHFIPQSWTRVVDRSSMALAVDKKFLASIETEYNIWTSGLTRDGKLFAYQREEDGESSLILYNLETQKVDVHNRKEDRIIAIDWFDTSTWTFYNRPANWLKEVGSFRWFAIPDFIETLVAVMPRVNPSLTVCLESHQEGI